MGGMDQNPYQSPVLVEQAQDARRLALALPVAVILIASLSLGLVVSVAVCLYIWPPVTRHPKSPPPPGVELQTYVFWGLWIVVGFAAVWAVERATRSWTANRPEDAADRPQEPLQPVEGQAGTGSHP